MIRQEDINKIAGYFGHVETYLDGLGLIPSDQADVKDIVHSQHSNALAMAEALIKAMASTLPIHCHFPSTVGDLTGPEERRCGS